LLPVREYRPKGLWLSLELPMMPLTLMIPEEHRHESRKSSCDLFLQSASRIRIILESLLTIFEAICIFLAARAVSKVN